MQSASKYFKILILTFVGFFYSYIFTSVQACEVFTSIEKNICNGQSYLFGTDTLTIAGIYSDTLSNDEACDSIVTLTLTVSENDEIFLDETICEGQTFFIGNVPFQTEGNHTVTLQNQLGCDSIVHLDLKVNPVVIHQQQINICEGETYQVGTNFYNINGTYRDTLTSITNCDSIVITELIVTPTKRTNIQASICSGESFSVGNQQYSTPGTYRDTLQSYLDCDSIVTLQLQINPIFQDTIIRNICQGDSFFFGDQNLDTAGVYTYNFESANLCDSIVVLYLNVFEKSFHQQSFSICEGQTIQVGNGSYNTNGTFTDTLVNTQGCDSIVITNITVHPTERTQLTPTICQGQTFTVGSSIYTNSGIYTDTLNTIHNCDSIVSTILTVNDVLRSTQNISLCEGNSYEWSGFIINTSGTYVDTLPSNSGCDSIITLVVTVLIPAEIEIQRSVCAGSTFTVGQNTYDSTGTYIDTLQNIAGCDSIVILHLTVKDAIIRNINTTICEGNTFQVGDSIYDRSGFYTNVLKAIDGCDSTINLQLQVVNISRTTLTPTICQGSFFEVGTKKYQTSGTYIDTLENQFFCDSIITTILTVQPNTSEQITRTICLGQSITIGNNTYQQAGLYRDTLSSTFGCDSIIILRLFVQNQITSQQNINLCEGQSYTINNHTYTETGTYIDTLISSGGCDSIVTSILQIRPKYQIEVQRSICDGESILFGDQDIKTAGTYTHTFSSVYACDSVVQLTVNILRKDYQLDERNSCMGQTIRIRNVNYTSDTTFLIHLTNSFGCDSILEYRLKFHPVYNIQLERSVCKGKTYENIPIHRDTTIIFQLKSVAGCDSIVQIKINALDQLITERNFQLCEGSEHFGFIVSKDTIFKRVLNSVQGCDSIVVDTIKILESTNLTTSQDTTVNPGTQLTLFASGAQNYVWNTGATTPTIVVKPQATTTYTVTGYQANGCVSVSEIIITINSCNITAANYFTPNGDGVHDKWKLKGAECLSEFTLKIINRWGEVIFESSDIQESWDGHYKNQPVPEGVYFFILEGLSAQDQKSIHQNGYIHLNR